MNHNNNPGQRTLMICHQFAIGVEAVLMKSHIVEDVIVVVQRITTYSTAAAVTAISKSPADCFRPGLPAKPPF
jgi:hypothetical protein